MNWKGINEKYPKAFLEYIRSEDRVTSEEKVLTFIGSDANNYYYDFTTELNYAFCIPSDEVIKLPFYFDTLGIVIEMGIRHKRRTFFCLIEGHSYFINKNYTDRTEATIAAVTKAFEIREGQLNNSIQE